MLNLLRSAPAERLPIPSTGALENLLAFFECLPISVQEQVCFLVCRVATGTGEIKHEPLIFTGSGGKPAPNAVIWLEGHKLRGGYVLQRTRGKQWLLIKQRDEGADARRNPVNTQPESVLSGRRIEDLRSRVRDK